MTYDEIYNITYAEPEREDQPREFDEADAIKQAKKKASKKIGRRRRNQRRPQKPLLYKIVLEDNQYTPHEEVFRVIKAAFDCFDDAEIWGIIMTAEKDEECLIIILPKEEAETKTEEANEKADELGHPELVFRCEPETDPNKQD